MTIEIPVWLIWTLGLVIGVPLVLAALALMVLGVMFLRLASNWRR